MRLGSTIAAAGLAAFLGAGAAQAAPMTTPPATLQQAVYYGNTPHLELVRGGCGWGAHRTWHGYCRYNGGWRGHWRYWHSWRRW